MEIDANRWGRIKALFDAALEQDSSQRAAFLRGACSDDDLRLEVEKLLRNHEQAGDFLGGRVVGPNALTPRQILSEISEAPEFASTEMGPSRAAAAAGQAAPPSSRFELVSTPGGSPPEIAEVQDPLVGRRLGAYKILRQIGYGGMAAVYLGARADQEYRKQVAIKIVRPGQDTTELLNRFRTERQTLAALDHPNIVKLLDGGSTDEGLPYLVMDYVEGSPIDEYCDGHKLSINQRLQLFCMVCDAVHHAHQQMVIHRDLKPSNILVTPAGVPKLLDFGIAKVLESADESQASVTQTRTRRMTPAYASPEQVKAVPVTAATDVYSLGVVLYELLTGHRPYKLKQHTPAEIERAICEEDPEKPSTAVERVETETLPDGTSVTKTPEIVSQTREGRPDKLRQCLRGDLDTILLMALQKQQQLRYASVQAFSEDIQRHLDHLPVNARRPTLSYRSSKFIKRHKSQVLTAAMIVLLVIAGTLFVRFEEKRAAERARAEAGGEYMPGRRSVAVLGFKNLSGRPETSWVSTALAEMLTTELAAGGQLSTVPGENVAHMKSDLSIPETDSLAPQTLRRVRRNLGSDYVVLGSYLDLGGNGNQSVRLDARLQDAVVGQTVAAVAETGTEADLAGLVSRAGNALRSKLGATEVAPTETAKIRASEPSNLDALRLYSEGLAKLRGADPGAARTLLEQAVASDPNSAVIHAGLAEVWGQQGYDAKAKEEAKKALDLVAGLPREQSLSIEGEALRVTRQWVKDAEVYRTLFTFFPDNVTYGIRLVTALSSAGKGADAMAAVDELRKLPPPLRDDPGVDLAEARAAERLPDFKLMQSAAARAADKAKVRGARGLEAEARLIESRALGRLGESQRSLASAEESRRLWAAAGDRYGVARALNNIGYAEDDLGRYDDAKKAYTESLHVLHELGNRWNEAVLLINLGAIYHREGDLAGAKQAYQESLAISRELGALHNVAIALADLANMEVEEGEVANAKAHIDEAVAIDRSRNDQTALGEHLNTLANVLLAKEDFSAAIAVMEETITINRKIGQKNPLGQALYNLGKTLFNHGELVRANKSASEALELFTATGNEDSRGIALEYLARFSLAAGDLPNARNLGERALAAFDKIGDKQGTGESRLLLANLFLEEGNVAGAEPLARQATEDFQKVKHMESEGEADTTLARVLREQGKLNEAESTIARARELVPKTRSRQKRLAVAIEDARIQVAHTNNTQAARLLSDASAEAKQAGLVPLDFEARLALGEMEMKSGNFASGRTALKTLEREARAKGFLLIARKAAALRKHT